MYMITKGKSGYPLIKLSEGYSINSNNEFVLCVCGTNGERINPIKIWDTPFNFFDRENINAEFISKTELICVKITKFHSSFNVLINKYFIPEFMKFNKTLDYDAIRKMKPSIEQLLSIEVEKYGECVNFDVLHEFLNSVYDGKFRDVVICCFNKFIEKDKLWYCL